MTLPRFFQVLLRTSLQKTINSTGKSTLQRALVKFQGDTFEESKDILVARLSNKILQGRVYQPPRMRYILFTEKPGHSQLEELKYAT